MKPSSSFRWPRTRHTAIGTWGALALAATVTASTEGRSRTELPAPESVSLSNHPFVVVAQDAEKSGAEQPAKSPWLDYYIVQLVDRPLASYQGNVPGLASTSPEATGAQKLDTNSPAAASYRRYLGDKRQRALTAIEQRVGHRVEVLHHYSMTLHGFAIQLTPHEAKRIRTVEGVARVERNELRQPLTDAGPSWIGAPGIWNGSATGGLPATKGEGIIVGVIDSGINSDHPSFADVGGDGYDHTNPFGSGNYAGWCEAGFPIVATCNDKLIGQWSFADSNNDPEDDDGHGSHTAGTAAGNQVSAGLVANTITIVQTISGVAPHANLIAYDACIVGAGCPTSALLASIDQATADGVDVINYSISGGNDPYNDSVSQAFLDATAAGVFISASAGDAGPGPSTTGHNEPWVQSVGATTHSRKFINGLVDLSGGNTTPPADIVGTGLTSAYGLATIVYAGDFGDPLCPLGGFPPGTWVSGEIVVCDRGGGIPRVDKAQSVFDGGAGGFVLANDQVNGDTLAIDAYVLPGVHITYAAGVVLKAWVADGGASHQGEIAGAVRDVAASNADVMGDFSSRGPSATLPDILKPDLTAPGVEVWAADRNGASPPEYQLLSGTSMASPHAAGAAALVRALHPSWSPAQVKSALMLTAVDSGVRKEDGTTAADPFDMGAGRIDLSAAGQIGFVLGETAADFAAADPSLGGDPTTLNLASLADGSCFLTCSFSRTVTSVVGTRSWNATIAAPAGLAVAITTPNPFTLLAGGSAQIDVTVDVSQAAKDQWYFATITWSDGPGGASDARMPVAVFAQASTDALTVTKAVDYATTAVGATASYTIQVSNNSFGTTSFNVTDPIPANSTYVPGSATGGLTYNAGPDSLTGSTGVLDPATFDLVASPSPFGYVAPDNLSGGYADRCLSTTQCDESATMLNLSGDYFFYQGQLYSTVLFGSNGVVLPGGSTVPPFINQNLPDPAAPNNVIAPFWADLDGNGTSGSDPGAGFYYFGLHENPITAESYLVLGWEGMQLFNDPSRTYTVQVWIKLGTDQIWFVYDAFDGGLPDTADGGLTVGIENATGTEGFTRFYRELGSCVPGPCNDSGTPPDVGTDLMSHPALDSATFTFAVTVDDGTPFGTWIQNVVTATNGSITAQAVASTVVEPPLFADGFESGDTSAWSASQFSREYTRLFGLPPRRDAEHTRAAVAGGGPTTRSAPRPGAAAPRTVRTARQRQRQ